MHAMHCSDWGALLMRAFIVPSSKPTGRAGPSPALLVGTPLYFTLSVALARALGPPASSPAGAVVPRRAAASFTLLIHLCCCARAAERTARYAVPWKSFQMHATASAIAGSLRISTAPTGSWNLLPPGSYHFAWAPSAAAGEAAGRPDQ
jgi:hypothetical protein